MVTTATMEFPDERTTLVIVPPTMMATKSNNNNETESRQARCPTTAAAAAAGVLLVLMSGLLITSLLVMPSTREDPSLENSSLVSSSVTSQMLVGWDHMDRPPNRNDPSSLLQPLLPSEVEESILVILRELDAQLDGSVVLRPSTAVAVSKNRNINVSSSSSFAEAAHVWNQVTDPPLAVVQVAHEADAVVTLPILSQLFLQQGVEFRIRSGGHHYAGWSGMADGIVLSLSALNQIDDAGKFAKAAATAPGAATASTNASRTTTRPPSMITAWVGPTVRVQDILQDVHRPYQYSSVIGMCRTVAIGGYALGGGQGLWARQYGLGLDQLVGARLVLWNGTILELSSSSVEKDHRRDILWALQGAGQNNFGVVSQLQYRFYPSYDEQVLMSVDIPQQDMPQFFHDFAALESQWPGNVGAFLSNGGNDDGDATDLIYNVLIWYTCLTKEDVSVGQDYLQYVLAPAVLPSSVSFHISVDSWYDLSMHRVPLREGNYVRIWNGFLYEEQNTPEACQNIWKAFAEARHATEFAKVGVELWGGAISDPASNATAFAWRQGIYNVHLWLLVPTSLPNAKDRFELDRQTLEPYWKRIAQHLTGTYINYAEASLGREEYARITYGENLERLMTLKKELDPYDIFHNPQSVPMSLS